MMRILNIDEDECTDKYADNDEQMASLVTFLSFTQGFACDNF